jgi:MFS transporter, DHA1 family, 2-module integral membrane pump EmrD
VKFKTVIILTALLSASGQLANTIFIPAITMMATALHVTPSSLQGLIAAYLAPYGISQFFYGPLADKYGRKPLIYFGLIVFNIGALLSFIGINYNFVLLGCILQGTGAGVAGVMIRTIMRDCFTGIKLQKANSYTTMALIIAPLIAPIIGGILAVQFGWKSIFLFLFIFATAILFLQIFFLKETNPNINKATVLQRYKILLSEKSFLFYTSYLMLAFSGIAVFEASIGILLGNVFKLSPEYTSIIFIIPIPFYLIGSFFASRAVKTYSLDKIIFIAIIIIALSSTALLITAELKILTITAIITPISAFMLGTGILCPTATTAALKPLGNIAGTAGAFLGGYQNIGAGLLTFMASMTPQTTQMPLALILSICATIMVTLLLIQKILQNYPYNNPSKINGLPAMQK